MKPNIVVIDDEEIILSAYQLVIEEMGCVGTVFNKTDKGLDYLRNHTEVRLAILDIMMPEIDGISALKQIKEFSPQLPVIISTAFADWNIISRNDALLKEYTMIRKPLDIHKLTQIIQIELKKFQKK